MNGKWIGWVLLAVVLAIYLLPLFIALKRGRPGPGRMAWLLLRGGWVPAWLELQQVEGFLGEAERAIGRGEHLCPSCGRGYELDDYRPDVPEIACSYCHARFPRPPG